MTVKDEIDGNVAGRLSFVFIIYCFLLLLTKLRDDI